MPEVLVTKHKRGFFDYFPAPRFLELAKTGVAISDQSLHLIEFSRPKRNGDLNLNHHESIPLAPGVITDGYVNDKETLVKAIKDLKNKHSFEFVRATLPEEKAYLFTVDVDKEPFASLRDRVAFTVEENVPVALAQSVFDFEIIGNYKDKPMVRVAVSVLPMKVVETYLDIFQLADIRVSSFDVESQALARSVIKKGDLRPFLIVNLNENKTGLYVVEDEVVQFSSTIPYGIKQDGGAYKDIESLKIELRKVFAFWNTRLDKDGIPEKKIEKILVAGSGAADNNFIEQLFSGIEASFDVVNVWTNAFSVEEEIPQISFEEALSFGVAIGTALPERESKYV